MIHKIKNIIIFIFIITGSSSIMSQSVYQDSLYKLIKTDKNNLDKVVRSIQDLAISIGDENLKIKADAYSGKLLYLQEKYSESFEALKDVAQRAKLNKMNILEAKIYGTMADIYGLQGNYIKGLKLAQRSLKMKKEHNAPKKEIAAAIVNIANFHGVINNLNLSTKYYSEARDIYLELNDTFAAYVTQLSIGLDRTMAGENEKARKILLDCLDNFKKVKNKKYTKSALSKLGSLEQQVGNLKLAQTYYDEALELATELGDSYGLSIMYQRNAHINIDQKNWKKAIYFANKALKISKVIGDKESIQREHEYLYKGYNGLGNHELAFQNLEKFTLTNDSLLNAKNISAINELETKFQNEKTESEIKLLEQQNQTKSLKLNWLITGIIGLLGIFGLFAFAMKQRIKSKEIEKDKLDQELTYKTKELDQRKKELTGYALQIAQKNKILEGIKSNIKEINHVDSNIKPFQKIINSINLNQNDDQSWEEFRARFLEVHKDFESNVKKKHQSVSPNELRFMSLMKMNLSSKEIANVLNISAEGIKKARYRLRKKLELQPSDSLEELIHNF